ncbi:Uncharacterised protein [Serratia liquefaciens]|nr:Uncharacterised protein [Serratia liquefaciens]
MKKENKDLRVTVRLSETQKGYLECLINEGKASTISNAMQYLINQYAVLGK